MRRVARPPYDDQVRAWSHPGAPDPLSVIVSSGTGSGKTECFLAPILDRLVRVSNRGSSTPTGVRAIMLNPLNALIASQRSEEHTSELQSLMRTSYAVLCLTKKKYKYPTTKQL